MRTLPLAALCIAVLSTPAFADDDAAVDTAGRWPRSVILRPLTLPKGVLMLGADLKTYLANDSTPFFDPATFRVAVGYGITDDLEVAFLDYAFPTNGAGKGKLSANLGYKILRGASGGRLEMIARVQGGYGFAETTNAMMEDEGALLPLQLGVHVQYNVTATFSLITPGQQLSIGLADGHVSSLDLPIGIGYQATPELYTELDTSIAHINLHGDKSRVFFADSTPVTITAVYNAIPALDVLASIGTDVSNDIDQELTLLVGARYYVGRL